MSQPENGTGVTTAALLLLLVVVLWILLTQPGAGGR